MQPGGKVEADLAASAALDVVWSLRRATVWIVINRSAATVSGSRLSPAPSSWPEAAAAPKWRNRRCSPKKSDRAAKRVYARQHGNQFSQRKSELRRSPSLCSFLGP